MIIEFDRNFRKKNRISKAEAGIALYKFQGNIQMWCDGNMKPMIYPGYIGRSQCIQIHASDYLKATKMLQLLITDPAAARERYGAAHWKETPGIYPRAKRVSKKTIEQKGQENE